MKLPKRLIKNGGRREFKKNSEPYVLKIYNTSDSEKHAVLFGFNDNFNCSSLGDNGFGIFGNLVDINVQCCNFGMSYARLLCISNLKPLDVVLWRFSGLPAQLKVIMILTKYYANVQVVNEPIELSKIKNNNNQHSSSIDLEFRAIIDSGTEITIPILPETNISNPLVIELYSVFPVNKLNRALKSQTIEFRNKTN